MEKDGNFAVGMVWGVSLSIPLWISIFGWVHIIKNVI